MDTDLGTEALVRASTVVTGGKTLALVKSGVRTMWWFVATGTSTDATAMGHTGRDLYFK